MDVFTPPPPTEEPPAPPTPPARGPQAILGGLAAFIASGLAIDAIWVRIVFMVLALASGVGVLLYVGLWLVLIVGRRPGLGWLRVLGVAVVIVCFPLFAQAARHSLITGPVAVVALLAGLAFALWRPSRAQTPAAPPAAARFDAPTRATISAPRTPREPSILGRLFLGIAIVVAAGGALIDQANGGRLHPEQWLGIAAAVCGCGMLVGIWRGRARWLILPALAFAVAGFAAGTAARLGVGFHDLHGSRNLYLYDQNVSTAASRNYRLATVAGDVNVQVENLQTTPAAPIHVDARTAFGDVHVSSSDAVPMEVRWSTEHGAASLRGITTRAHTVHLGPSGTAAVIVDVTVGYGDVYIDDFTNVVIADPTTTGNFPQPPGVPVQGELTTIDSGVQMTSDGYVVLGGGEVVIGPDDRILSGQSLVGPDPNTQLLQTSFGEFRLLPRSLLLTPDQRVIDLQAARQRLAEKSTTLPSPGPTVAGG